MTVTSSADLALPDELSGPWDHALMLSYGLDLPFFERALARQLPSSCRNRILLGDERTLLVACEEYAESGLVRGANRSYVAEPILRRTSSHAKVVLLTSPTAGRMHVGSGNLSRQGFGSGAELFTSYTYNQDDDSALAEFVSIRDLLERLRDGDLLTTVAAWHVDRLLETTPWLYAAAPAPSRVRHTLDTPLATQLTDLIGDRSVSELVVAAPFFDEPLVALRSLVDTLKPDRITLLVQPERTSIDPDALDGLRADMPNALEVRPFERAPSRPWVHAKLLLVRTSDGDVCLQGSANISQAALLRAGSRGNLEVVNLLDAPSGTFDALLDGLDIGDPVDDLETLDVDFEPTDDVDELLESDGWLLTHGEWRDGRLELRHRGPLPDLHGVQLQSESLRFDVATTEQSDRWIVLEASSDGQPVDGVTPVRLIWPDGTTSNAIFPAVRAELLRTLESQHSVGGTLAHLGMLDLDDEELAELLTDLESALLIDSRSLWQLSGREVPADVTEDELILDYQDIDYDLLRSHPKLQQYLRGAGDGSGSRSPLAMVLHSITAAFGDLSLVDEAIDSTAAGNALELPAHASAEHETETDDDESLPQRRWAGETRLRVLFNNFIKRFLRGLTSREFQQLAGPHVVGHNVVVFIHLLDRLAERDWADHSVLADALARTSRLMWGDATQRGYAAELPADERAVVLTLVRDMRSDSQLLAALLLASEDAGLARDTESRLRLRDAWRGILVRGALPMTPVVLDDARVMLSGLAPPHGPSTTATVDMLQRLARFSTRSELVASVAERIGVPLGAGTFLTETVRSPALGDISVETLRIEHDEATLTLEDAQCALGAWSEAEQLAHYRIALMSRDGRRTRFVAFFEPAVRRGVFAQLGAGSHPPVSLTQVAAPPQPWNSAIDALRTLAREVDEEERQQTG
jgi:hypothetical protein